METTLRQSLTLLIACSTLGGCKAPNVNLSTSEPIKVDIAADATSIPHRPRSNPRCADPEARRRTGWLTSSSSRTNVSSAKGRGLARHSAEAGGDYGDYVRVTIEEENVDRMDLMNPQRAKNLSRKFRPNRATGKPFLKGEWIETCVWKGCKQWRSLAGAQRVSLFLAADLFAAFARDVGIQHRHRRCSALNPRESPRRPNVQDPIHQKKQISNEHSSMTQTAIFRPQTPANTPLTLDSWRALQVLKNVSEYEICG
jgi:hypothetical protein